MKLPIVSAKQLIEILSKQGFYVARQKGSHVILKKRALGKVFTAVVPNHAEIRVGTLLSILRQAGVSKQDFIKIVAET